MAYKVHLDTCKFCGGENTAQLIPHGIGIAKFFIVIRKNEGGTE